MEKNMLEHETDIAIIGGGMAGIAAAIAVSELGKEAIIVEKEKYLGGNAILSNVGTICGAYMTNTTRPIDHPMIRKLLDELKGNPIKHADNLSILPYEVDYLHELIKSWVDNSNVKVLSSASLVKSFSINDKIKAIRVKHDNEEVNLKARGFVDSSGIGVLSEMAGAEMLRSKKYQAASQVFQVVNVNSNNEFSLNFALRKSIIARYKEYNLPVELSSISVIPGSLIRGRAELKFILPVEINDGSSQKDLDKEGVYYSNRIFELLKNETESLHDSSIGKIYPQAGVRVRQRAKGKYILTEEDVLSCTKWSSDVAALGTWPIEEWQYSGKVVLHNLPKNDYYEIPNDCLRSNKISNLFLAGKNISATDRAIASARVIGTCVQTGYAAGKLAAHLP